MKFSASLTGFLVAAGLALASFAADAQEQQAAAPTAARPTDVKNIGDWTVRCFPINSPSPCDMYEQLDDKNTHQRVLSVSIAYVPRADRHAIQIVVPLGVSLAKGAVIATDVFTSPTLHFRRCNRSGCFVEMIMDNSAIASLSRSAPEAKIKIVADNGRALDLPFSLKSFAEAHDAMVELAKQKAKSAPPPAAPPPSQP